MIESFNEFLKKSGYSPVFERNYMEDVEVGFTEDDFKKPNFVIDDQHFLKYSSIVLKFLKRNFSKDWSVYPYIISANGRKASMIYAKDDGVYIVLTKIGIEKNVILYNQNPLEVEGLKFVISFSSLKGGFLDVLNTLISFIGDINGGINVYINESISKLTKDDGSVKNSVSGIGVKGIVDAIMGEGAPGRRSTENSIPRYCMKDFLELFEKMNDKEIAELMVTDWCEKESLKIVQEKLFADKKTKRLPDLSSVSASGVPTAVLNAQGRQVKLIHMILCGCDDFMPPDKATLMRECWFWGAGKTGKLLVEMNARGEWIVSETLDDIAKGTRNLDRLMNRVTNVTEAMLRCVQQGGGAGTLDDLRGMISGSRGMFITGLAGIGKSRGIQDAIEATKAKENVDYVYEQYSSPIELYKQLYKYNGMVIIFEEGESMLEDNKTVQMLKFSLSPDEIERQKFQAPGANATKASTSGGDKKYGGWYDVSMLSRRERYFCDVGIVSDYERKKIFKKKLEDIKKEEGMKSSDELKLAEKEMVRQAMIETEEECSSRQEAQYPTKFIFNGYVIITTNKPVSDFITDKSLRNNWGAIKSRLSTIDISPTYKVVWNWIKGKIMDAAKNTDIPDEMRLLPLKGKAQDATLENVVAYIDSVMDGTIHDEGSIYGMMNFRVITSIKDIVSSSKNTREDWEDYIKNVMLISSERKDV